MIFLKYGALAAASLLWLGGLADQLHSWELAGKYLIVSALMVAATLL